MRKRAAGARLKLPHTIVVIGTMLLAACGSEAKQASKSEATHSPFSVVHVRTGMSPTDVEGALKAKGFEVTTFRTRDTFASALAEARFSATHTNPTHASDYGRAVTHIHGKKGDEVLDVGLTDLEKGPIVSDATYHAPLGGSSFAATKADLVKRYGNSVDQNPGMETSWCPTAGGSYCDLTKPSLRLLATGGGPKSACSTGAALRHDATNR